VLHLPYIFNTAVVEYVEARAGGMCGELFEEQDDGTWRVRYRTTVPSISTMFSPKYSWWDSVHPSDKPYLINIMKIIQHFSIELEQEQEQERAHAILEATAFAERQATEKAKKTEEVRLASELHLAKVKNGGVERMQLRKMNSFALPQGKRARLAINSHDDDEDGLANALTVGASMVASAGASAGAVASTVAVTAGAGLVSCLKGGGGAVVGEAVETCKISLGGLHRSKSTRKGKADAPE
jgi:hypothetical protein